jgi:hypothetical protein
MGMEVRNLEAGVNGERIGARRGANGAGNRDRVPVREARRRRRRRQSGVLESLRFQLEL